MFIILVHVLLTDHKVLYSCFSYQDYDDYPPEQGYGQGSSGQGYYEQGDGYGGQYNSPPQRGRGGGSGRGMGRGQGQGGYGQEVRQLYT